MNKFLKKNIKKIIVICLIMLLLSNKMYENFTTVQALDAVKATEKKVNEMVSKVDGSHVRFPKKVVLDKGLAMGSLKMAPGNWLDYGIEVPAGKKVGIHAPGNGTMELHVDNTIKTSHIYTDKLTVNGLKIKNPKKGATEIKIHDGYWGGWTDMKTCPDNTYVCGLKARVESPGGDDTAMNGIHMKCCKFNP
jgi:hypothetical protein